MELKIVCMRWNMNCLQMSVTKLAQEVVRIQKTAKAIAALDVFASLALVAERNNFVKTEDQ